MWVRRTKDNKDNNVDGDFNIYKPANIIYKKYKSIIDIQKKEKFKAEVLLSNRTEANLLIKDKNVIDKGMVAFIPPFGR